LFAALGVPFGRLALIATPPPPPTLPSLLFLAHTRCLHPNLQTLLRDQLGFKGYIISDAGAITFAGPDYHGYTPNVTLAACLAMDAGTGALAPLAFCRLMKQCMWTPSRCSRDLVCGCLPDLALGGEFGPSLGDCVSTGLVNTTRIQQAISRLLSAQFQLG
jgi:hypothetical protein